MSDCILVHNGVVSNYEALKSELQSKGYTFYGDTDSEVVVMNRSRASHHSSKSTKQGKMYALKSLSKKCTRLEGEFALCIYMPLWKNSIFAVSRESPLVLVSNQTMRPSDEVALRDFCDEHIHAASR